MRHTDLMAVGSFFSIKSIFMIMDLCNIIQLAWDTKWIIAGDEANNTVCLAFENGVEVTVKLFFSNPSMYIEYDTS